MPPRVFLVRHGEAEHNVPTGSARIKDSFLTPHGVHQCLHLRDTFLPHGTHISLILASPLRRAIQTAAYAFSPYIQDPSIPFILLPEAQELNAYPCDIGHAREDLAAQLYAEKLFRFADVGFEVGKVDLGFLVPGWNCKVGKWAVTRRAVTERAASLRRWLFARTEECVVLVTHGDFLHEITEDWTGYGLYNGTGWANCEIKEFRFTSESTTGDAHLEETSWSLALPTHEETDPHVLSELEDAGLSKKTIRKIHETKQIDGTRKEDEKWKREEETRKQNEERWKRDELSRRRNEERRKKEEKRRRDEDTDNESTREPKTKTRRGSRFIWREIEEERRLERVEKESRKRTYVETREKTDEETTKETKTRRIRRSG